MRLRRALRMFLYKSIWSLGHACKACLTLSFAGRPRRGLERFTMFHQHSLFFARSPRALRWARLAIAMTGCGLATLVLGACAATTPRPTEARAAELCVAVPEAEARAGLAGMQGSIEGVRPLLQRVPMGRAAVFSKDVGATV